MNQQEKNKELIYKFYDELNWAKQHGEEAFMAIAKRFTEDPKLLDHLTFFQRGFPKASRIIEDVMAERDRVFVRETFTGRHEGEIEGIPPTQKVIEVPFAACYTIRNKKIVDFWTIANEVDFLEQLGIKKEQVIKPPNQKL